MNIGQALELLEIEERKYINIEDKNYYLVHKYNEILKEIALDEVSILQDNICRKYKHKDFKSFLEYVCLVSEYVDFQKVSTHAEEKTNDGEEYPSNILDFYEHYDNNMLFFLKGHLFIEYYMKIIIRKLNVSIDGFYNKIQIMYNYHLINEKMKDLLEKVNKTRNNIVHEISYKLKFDTVFDLVNLSVSAGVDYSDETIHSNKKLCYDWYGVKGVLDELFPNTIYTLLECSKKLFTDEELNMLLV